MDLSAKFNMVTSCQQIRITSLSENTPYPIERAERTMTKYGEAIILTLLAEPPHTYVKVFLPRRYGSLFTDENLGAINQKTIFLSLKYMGTMNNSYILEIE